MSLIPGGKSGFDDPVFSAMVVLRLEARIATLKLLIRRRLEDVRRWREELGTLVMEEEDANRPSPPGS